MKISVTHSTIYRYDSPVILEPHIFRLQPRTHSAATAAGVRAADCALASRHHGVSGSDGNLALNAWFNAPTTELNVQNRFTVEMLRENPFDYVIVGEWLHLPLWYREPLSAALASYKNDAHVAEPVRQLANAVAAGSQQNALTFLLALSQQILQSCRQVIRPTGAPWPSHETLRRREGSSGIWRCFSATPAGRWESRRDLSAVTSARRRTTAIRTCMRGPKSICQAFGGGATIHPADWRFPTATLPWPLDSIPNSRPRSPAGIPAGHPRTWKRRSACTWIAQLRRSPSPCPLLGASPRGSGGIQSNGPGT